MPDAELVAELPVPSECVRRVRWLIGDIGLRAESLVAHALDADGQHVEAWQPECVMVVTNISLRCPPADAEVLVRALEWAGLVSVTCTSKGHAGTSSNAADGDQAPRLHYVSGTIVGQLPEASARPPAAAGEPVMGWALVPPIRTRIAAGTEIAEEAVNLAVVRECEKCHEQLPAGWPLRKRICERCIRETTHERQSAADRARREREKAAKRERESGAHAHGKAPISAA